MHSLVWCSVTRQMGLGVKGSWHGLAARQWYELVVQPGRDHDCADRLHGMQYIIQNLGIHIVYAVLGLSKA